MQSRDFRCFAKFGDALCDSDQFFLTHPVTANYRLEHPGKDNEREVITEDVSRTDNHWHNGMKCAKCGALYRIDDQTEEITRV